MYFYDTEAGITNITDVHVASRANPYILEVRSGQPRAVEGALEAMADAPTARQSSSVGYDVVDALLTACWPVPANRSCLVLVRS